MFGSFDDDGDALLTAAEFDGLYRFFSAYVDQAALDELAATLAAMAEKAADEAAKTVLPLVRKAVGADRYAKVTAIFGSLDTDASGTITADEFIERLVGMGIDKGAIDGLSALFKKIDADAGGSISYRELIKVLRVGLA